MSLGLRPRHWIAGAAVVALAVTAPRAASAQVGGDIDLNLFRPAMDSRGYLTINASQVLGHGELSFGMGALDWGYKLASFEAGANEYTVKNMFAATLIAAYGLKAGPVELELGASVPLIIMSGDRNPDSLGDPGNPNDDQLFKFSGQGLGNVGLHLKTRFLKTTKKPRIGLGLIASVYLPTVSEKGAWLGESKATPQIMAIVDKEFGRRGRFKAALNAGIRIRSAARFVDTGTGGANSPATNVALEAESEIPVGLGLSYAISPQKFDVIGEVFGAIPLGSSENYQPAEAIGGIKVYLARNSFLSLGGGAGLMPAKGGNPDVRAFIGIVFEPNIGDRDGDGLKDDVDQCPLDPEDKDGFEDENGCPDPDNDQDGIADTEDKCPNEPGIAELQGCPEGTRTPTATASSTPWTSARTTPRTSTSSRTRTAAPIRTTTRTASSTSTTSAPERPRGQGRLRGRGRLPRPRQRRRRHPRRERQVPARGRLRQVGRLQGQAEGRPHRRRDQDPREGVLRHRQGHDQEGLLPPPRRGR
jgi:OOP family OmpA-OmpF porin